MVNFMCQFDRAQINISSGSVMILPDEINIWVCGLHKSTLPFPVWVHTCNPFRAWLEQKPEDGGIHRSCFLLAHLSWDTSLRMLLHQGLHHCLIQFSGYEAQTRMRPPALQSLQLVDSAWWDFPAFIIMWAKSSWYTSSFVYFWYHSSGESQYTNQPSFGDIQGFLFSFQLP